MLLLWWCLQGMPIHLHHRLHHVPLKLQRCFSCSIFCLQPFLSNFICCSILLFSNSIIWSMKYLSLSAMTFDSVFFFRPIFIPGLSFTTALLEPAWPTILIFFAVGSPSSSLLVLAWTGQFGMEFSCSSSRSYKMTIKIILYLWDSCGSCRNDATEVCN